MESSPEVELARKTIETYIRTGKKISAPLPIPPLMKEKAGVFVSIKKGGALRGCIGTFAPTTSSIAEEIIENAISAAVRDPRFPPISEDELEDLEISVDVLATPEPVKSVRELNAKNYGVIVKSGAKRGLLLPDLEGVDTVEQQIEICKRKAWIADDEPIELFRFEVRRYH